MHIAPYDSGISVFHKDALQSPNALDSTFGEFTEHSIEIVDRNLLASTELGRFALPFVFSACAIMRPALRQPTRLLSSFLAREIKGGPKYNPSLGIDKIDGALARYMARNWDEPLDVYIEEQHRWTRFRNDPRQNSKMVVVDPLDGTSNIYTGLRDQAVGIAVTDGNQKYAGAIGSLVDDEVVFVERDSAVGITNVRFITFDERTGEVKQLPIPKKKTVYLPKAKLATLDRRVEALRNTSLFDYHNNPALNSLGGYSVLTLIRGQTHAVIDPLKGQPLKEAVIWGGVAQMIPDLVVTNGDAEPIDFMALMREAQYDSHLMDVRVPIIMANSVVLGRQISEAAHLMHKN